MGHKVTTRTGFHEHVLFLGSCPGVRVVFQKSSICPDFCTIQPPLLTFFGVLVGPASPITPSVEEFKLHCLVTKVHVHVWTVPPFHKLGYTFDTIVSMRVPWRDYISR